MVVSCDRSAIGLQARMKRVGEHFSADWLLIES